MTPGRVLRAQYITRGMVQANPETVYVFGDNMLRRGKGGQAAQMRGEPNTVGVPTKWAPSRNPEAYFSDADMDNHQVRLAIFSAFRVMEMCLRRGKDVVIPANGLGTGLAELSTRAPMIDEMINAEIAVLEAMYPAISA